MAPEAQSCRGSFFVLLFLFTRDLRRLSTEERQSTSILPAGSPWIVTVAAWPRPDMGAQDETPGTPDCSRDIRDTLAGMGSCRVCRSTEMAQLSREGAGPCTGYANACPGTNSTRLKICIYRIEWEMVGEGKKSDCSLDENHFTHWLEK